MVGIKNGGLYYEAHVTVDPVFEDRLSRLKETCRTCGFRVADLIMRKGPNGPDEKANEDSFATARSDEWEDIRERTMTLVKFLKFNRFTVRRYKIELAIVDSKLHDQWTLLPNANQKKEL